jgi:hypothetical protein
MSKRPERLPEVLDPSNLEEHGVTIPVPTPTAISIPNPWKPSNNGNGNQTPGNTGGNAGSSKPASGD